MSDQRAREAERALALNPRSEDLRAAVLRLRLRAGELTAERVAVAALCGDAAARSIAGTLEAGTIPALCQALADGAGRETCVRAAWLAAEHAFRVVAPWASPPARCWEELSLAAIKRWLDDPTDERAAEAVGVAQDGREDRGLPEDEVEWWGRPAMLLALRPPEELHGEEVLRGETAWAFFLRLALEADAEAMVGPSLGCRVLSANRESVLAATKHGLREWAVGQGG